MTKQEQIEEMARKICIFKHHWKRYKTCKECFEANEYTCQTYRNCKAFIEEGYRKLSEDSVVLSSEEYEKLRSLYDCEQGSYMTSSIGDLPLTVEGLRKAVDEITRLNRVEAELQELNIKYYNEAKDLRRELKQASKETAEKILNTIYDKLNTFEAVYEIDYESYVDDVLWEIAKQFGLEIKE